MPFATNRILEYAVTAAHLKPSQLYHRLRLGLRQKLLYRMPPFRSWCEGQASGNETVRPFEFPHLHAKPVDADAIEAGTFTFLNRTLSLGDPIDWFPEGESRLWIFHLHSFDYAVALANQDRLANQDQQSDGRGADLLKRLIQQWIEACPPVTRNAWHPYPTSLRIANWIKAYSLLSGAIEQDADFARRLRRSLYSQACFLSKHLEYDLLNNHLLENGRAIYFAGHFFDDPRARSWRRRGREILQYGLLEHVLPDGGHNELSPMYHQIVLEIFQDVASVMNQRDQQPPAQLSDAIAAMQSWLRSVLHPDGHIPLFNDAAFAIAPEPDESLDGDVAVTDGLSVLPDSGLFGFRDVDQDHFLIFDCGPIGPDHQPGHGHCDALSYELSLAGLRMIVDSGVEQYHDDPDWRTFYRSTRAHNTIVVDGAEQSEIWGAFRVARRGRPLATHWQSAHEICYVTSGHSGYMRLAGKVRHQRFVCWVDRRFWVVADRITGIGRHEIESFIHFHPDVVVGEQFEPDTDSQVTVARRGPATLQILPWSQSAGSPEQPCMDAVTRIHGSENPIQGWYAPEFGKRLARTTWCHSGIVDLPLWTGYVLWPEPTAASVQCDTGGDSGESLRLAVGAGNLNYSLRFGPQQVILDKASAAKELTTIQE